MAEEMAVTTTNPVLVRWAGRLGMLAALLAVSGCGKGDGVSDYDRKMQGIQNAAEDLKSKGAKIEDRNFPQGQAKAVNLTGMQVDDQLLRQVKSLGNITELNLSKSTLKDEHMALFNELGLGTLAMKLDLSHTSITNAGFEKLDNLRFLGQLNLTGTKVTRATVENFKKKRQTDARILPMFRNPTVQVD